MAPSKSDLIKCIKTELIYFRNKKHLYLKIVLSGVKLFETNRIKYVGIIFDKLLTFNG